VICTSVPELKLSRSVGFDQSRELVSGHHNRRSQVQIVSEIMMPLIAWGALIRRAAFGGKCAGATVASFSENLAGNAACHASMARSRRLVGVMGMSYKRAGYGLSSRTGLPS
jgi:hypothetical protein